MPRAVRRVVAAGHRPSWRIAAALVIDAAELGSRAAQAIAAVGSLALDGPTYFMWIDPARSSARSLAPDVRRTQARERGERVRPAGCGRARHGGRAGGDRGAGVEHTEVFPLALFALSGMMLFPASNDLITMFVALEILSLPLYLLCGLARRRRLLSQEASLKYFLLGALSSAFFLYGAALLYGYSGSFDLVRDRRRAARPARRAPGCCSPGWRCSGSGCCSSSARCRSTPGPRRLRRCADRRSPASWRPAPRSPPSVP